MHLAAILLWFTFVLATVDAKMFSKCGLATELVGEGVPQGNVHHWVCMAEHESGFRTDATNNNSNNSTDYGIFQINSYWNCDPQDGRKTKNGCGHPCSDYRNSDLSDDIACIRKLIREHHTRGGFKSFSYGYKRYCQRVKKSYLKGCF